MTQGLTPAQRAQMDNRDATGQFKAKTHADAEDTADVLGVEDTFSPASNEHVETIDDEFLDDEDRRTAIRNASEIIETELPTDEQTGALEEAVEEIRGGDTDGPTIAGRAIRFAHDEDSPASRPLTTETRMFISEDERQVLQDDSFDRARYHEASEQAHYEELAGHLDDDRTFNGSDAYDGQLEDYAANADRHNAHVAAKIAFSAPAEATVAQISQGEPPVFYDRNGETIEDPEAGGIHTEFHRGSDHRISMVPADMRYRQDSDLGGGEGTEWLDLEAARADSDVHHAGGGGVGAPPRSDEVKALQTKANLRRLIEDDVVYKGDHVQSGPVSGSAVGTAFDAGVNDIQVFSDRGIETVDGEAASTSRQRDITI